MCRHVAYLGTPVRLHDHLFGAPHALRAQARAPRHQDVGDTNPDGWGVGWYVDGIATPARYRTTTPLWDDHEFARRSLTIETSAYLAAARLASPGAAIADTGNAPFRSGPWLFSLNGIVHRFFDGVGDELRARLAPARRDEIVGDTDSEVLFAMALDRLDAGAQPAEALDAVVRDVSGLTTGRINLLLTDGHCLAGTRSGRSLFVRGSTIASEPLDDDEGWREVPDGAVVSVAAVGHDAEIAIGTR